MGDLPDTPGAPYLIMKDQVVEAVPLFWWHIAYDGIFPPPIGRDGRPSSNWHQETIVGSLFVDPVRDRGCLLPILDIRDEVLH